MTSAYLPRNCVCERRRPIDYIRALPAYLSIVPQVLGEARFILQQYENYCSYRAHNEWRLLSD